MGGVGVEGRAGGGGDLTQEDDFGLVRAQQDILRPAKALLPRLATGSEPAAQPVVPVEARPLDRFVPGGGLPAFLEGQDLLPVKLPSPSTRYRDRSAPAWSLDNLAGRTTGLVVPTLRQRPLRPSHR